MEASFLEVVLPHEDIITNEHLRFLDELHGLGISDPYQLQTRLSDRFTDLGVMDSIIIRTYWQERIGDTL